MKKYTNAEIELTKDYLSKRHGNRGRIISASEAVDYLDTVIAFKSKESVFAAMNK